MPDAIAYVRQQARALGLDPDAVLAVAKAESGLDPFALGDAGTSFGLFQLHRGGALPGHVANPRDWAASIPGLSYALRQIASIAHGLTGRAAVEAIVRNFERPADPSGEIARAYGYLGSTPAPAPTSSPPAPGPTATVAAPPPPAAISHALLASLNNSLGASPVNADLGMPTRLNIKLDTRGTLAPPKGRTAPATGTAAAIAAAATGQLGQPYVWGGESRAEGGFDCSGLVDWAMRQNGYKGPRLTTWNIAALGRSVKGQELRPGDLVLANGGRHVVIYAGGGKVIAAPHRGTVVQYQPLSRFRVVDVRRVS